MSVISKPFTHINEQIDILQKRSLVITDRDDAWDKLLHHNYYTVINGYKYPFLDDNSVEEKYIDGTSFDELFALYTFDCNLRALLLRFILKVEHQLKSVLSHHFAKIHSDEKYPYYLRPENFDIGKDGKLPPRKRKDMTSCIKI